jgi:hypothetical protein
VQVTHQPDQARLVGVDREQGRSVRICFILTSLHRHSPQGAHGVEVILIHLAPHLDLVGTGFVHAASYRADILASIVPRREAAHITQKCDLR